MNREQLLKLHEDATERSRGIMTKKNADYADGGQDLVFGNLDLIEALFPTFSLNKLTTEVGIIVRMGDKLKRLATGVQREFEVKDEGFEDTCLDLINYTILLMAKRQSRAGSDKSVKAPPSGDEWERLKESVRSRSGG